jgi:transposase
MQVLTRWHGAKALVVPNNISLVPLPPRAPELNGQENIWQFMRQNWLSNRIFKSFDDIVLPLLLRLEHTHRPTLEDYVHRATRLGSSRSLNLRIGIMRASRSTRHRPETLLATADEVIE